MPTLPLTRRRVLDFSGSSLTAAAMTSLLMGDGSVRADSVPGEARDVPHFTPKARRVVHLCLCGGLSHIDSFDYKPELARFHGKVRSVRRRSLTRSVCSAKTTLNFGGAVKVVCGFQICFRGSRNWRMTLWWSIRWWLTLRITRQPRSRRTLGSGLMDFL
jgi:hypothetical protein